MTEQQYIDALAIYNPNGGYRTGKTYNVRDTQPRGSYNLLNESWNIAQAVKVGTTIAAHTEKLFDFPSFKVSEDTSNGHHYAWMQTLQIRGDVERTIHVKKGNRRYVYINARDIDDSSMVGAEFDLDTGSIVSNNASYTPTITDVGNGWYKIIIFVVDSQSGFYDIGMKIGMTNTSGVYSYTGTDGYTYMAHAQITLETGNSGIGVRPYVMNGNGFDLTVTGGGGTRINAAGNAERLEGTGLNRYPNSNNFTLWNSIAGVTLTPDSYTPPSNKVDGATLMVEDTSGATHGVYHSYVESILGFYTISVHVKFIDSSRNVSLAPIASGGRSPSGGVVFDSTGTAIDISPSTTYQSEALADGWFRFSVTGELTSAGTIYPLIRVASGTLVTYTGNGTSGVYIYGAQFEKGAASTFYGVTGVSGFPKIDHSTGQATFLAEPTSTNYVPYSSKFDQADWFKASGITLTPNDAIAPDGTSTAYRMVVDRTGGEQAMRPSPINGISAATDYTVSFWIRTVTGTSSIGLYAEQSGGAQPRVLRNIDENWQKISYTVNTVNTGSLYAGIISNATVGTPTVVDCYIWEAQVENSSIATSAIPTNGAALTRTINRMDVEFGGAHVANDYWCYADLTLLDTTTTSQQPFGLSGNLTATTSPRAAFSVKWNGTEWERYARPANTVSEVTLTGITTPTIKVAFNPLKRLFVINGVSFTTIAGGIDNGGFNFLTLGYVHQSGNPLGYSHVNFRDVRVLPPSVTEAEMITLTTP